MSQELTLKVVGSHTMHCSGCEKSVEFILSQLPGVQHVRADHKTQHIQVDLESNEIDVETIRSKLDLAGYQVERAH